jgi:hypothetical protein
MDENKAPTPNTPTPTKASDILHKDGKISSLRTYQGDMAEFIKEKNESVTSIALKEKAHREEKQKLEPKVETTKSHTGTFLAIVASLILLAGGGTLAFYVSQRLGIDKEAQVYLPTKIIPYSQTIQIESLSKEAIVAALSKEEFAPGVSLINFGENSIPVSKFIEILGLNIPSELGRNLQSEFAMGVFKKGESTSPILALDVTDFGGAFAGMLEWEKQMQTDLPMIVLPTSATSTLVWKDIIVKNKDARVLVDASGQSVISYAFLDKNTILITREYRIIPDINDLHVSNTISR